MTDYVTHHEGETLEDDYRRSAGGAEFGYLVPEALIARQEAAAQELDAATEAIRQYIATNNVPEVELDELDEQL